MLHELDPVGGGPDLRRDDYLDSILREAAESLDLTPTQHERLVNSYRSVGEWLDAPDSPLRPYRPVIYVQGSGALGTLTKPLGRDEFDIDATCVMTIPDGIKQAQLKNLVGDRLRAHQVYRGMLEEKSRCWRLNYAGAFHLDIIPAKPRFPHTEQTPILITDRELILWLLSDPKGYIAWFRLRKETARLPLTNRGIEAKVEPAPAQDTPAEKGPLPIAIQMMKRHRDVMFRRREDAPISIILTTLAAHAYQRERTIMGTLRNVLVRMPAYIDYSSGSARIANPTIQEENFADKWRAHPEREAAFYEWNRAAISNLDALQGAKGITQVRAALVPFLGENRVDVVLNRMAEKTNRKRDSGLKVDTRTGTVGIASGVAIPRTNFYGDA